MTTPTLSKEKLFAYLIVDDIQVPGDVLKKAYDDDNLGFYAIGQIYQDKEKYDKAMDWYYLGAAKGHADSLYILGWMYETGKGVPVNYKLAMEWYLKASDRGSVSAQNNIGCLYYNGHGVNQDFMLALEWFLKAADRGPSCAQYNVGVVYKNGGGLKVDKQYALEWYEKSAEQGYDKAKVQVKLLNDEGFYTDDRQKRHLQIEKDLKAKNAKIKSLESQLNALKQKQLVSDNENKLLKQENEVLRLKFCMDTKDQVAIKEDVIQQLAESLGKMMSHEVTPNTTKDSNADDENPENDIYYDQ